MNDEMYEWKSLETNRTDHELHSIKISLNLIFLQKNTYTIKYSADF